MIQLTCQHIHDWTYFTEGNAHVILNYTGDDTGLAGYVLRLTKANDDQNLPDGFHTDFRQLIITTLLGSDYVDHMEHIQVTSEFVKTISNKIYNDRPLHRRSSTIHYHSSCASLMKNWTLFYSPKDTWTFEIKPKWGFLPNSLFVDEKHQQLKKTMCRFCMHQRLRQQQLHNITDNVPPSTSHHYCPLDLYSGDPLRMRKALTASLARPHNYLKFFHNGELVPPTHWTSSFPSLFFNHQSSQQHPGNGTTSGMDDDDDDNWIKWVVDVLVEILIQDPILKTLGQLQQSLDEYDVEGIYPLYEKHGQQQTHDINHWKSILQQYMERQSQQNVLSDNKGTINPGDEKEELQRLYEYLLSMTLKDCSVMICLTKGHHQGDTTLPRKNTTSTAAMVQSSGGHCFQYQIKVVDVDMKKWNKIPYWFDLDRRIIQYNLQQEQDQLRCIDG